MGYNDFDSQHFAPVNVIIGKNDTGKTGLLKLLYASCKSVDIYTKRVKNEEISFRKVLAEKLTDTFQPGKKGLAELVNKNEKGKLNVHISFEHKTLEYSNKLNFSFGESTSNTINDCPESITPISQKFRCLFIPAKEVLTSLKAIRATRDNLHMPGFDDTYLDLIRALVIPTIKVNSNDFNSVSFGATKIAKNESSELNLVNQKLEHLFEGKIEQGDEDDFTFVKGNAEFPMQLTAEGVKKIGVLTTLIHNGQLNADSVLFLDEPETALHPEATRELVEMLMLMAKSGIQIFLATHNSFVLKQMHLSAKKTKVSVNCYSLTRNKENNITSTLHNLTTDFPENEISEEAIQMADEEVLLDLGL